MRVLLQRVTSAQVSVDGRVVGAIAPARAATDRPLPRGTTAPVEPAGQGLLALVGVTHTDSPADAGKLAEKVWRLRILDDERSAADIGAPILVISQFTLYANTTKGRRPAWNAAAPGTVAEPLVEAFTQALRDLGAHVATGVFGAHMQVELVNDGPVTVLLESPAESER